MKGLHSPGSSQLTADELVERLRLTSGHLIDEVYEISRGQLESEEKREATLGAKATALLTVSGLSLTVAFTFGGLLLQHPEILSSLGPASPIVACAFALALLCGLLASVWALKSLMVRSNYAGVNATDVFGDELRDADDLEDDEAIKVFRRYLAAHYWQVYENNFSIHEEKGRQIRIGQRLFVAFLVLIMVIGACMTYGMIYSKPVTSLATAAIQPPLPPPTVVCSPTMWCEDRKAPTPPPAPPKNPPPPRPRPPPTRVPSPGRRITESIRPPGHRPRIAPKGRSGS